MMIKKARRATIPEYVGMVLMLGVLAGCGERRDDRPLVYESIHEAAKKGDLPDVRRALQRGAAVNAKGEDGCTPLHFAALGGRKDVVEYLVRNGADVNAKSEDGPTPLHFAAFTGRKDVVEYLVRNGADVNARGKGGWTPLHLAALGIGGFSKDILELLGERADLNAEGSKEAAVYLISKGADVNARDEDGMTPLYHAANLGNKEAIECLVSKGADVNARDKDGMTPLHAAMVGGHWVEGVVVELLKRHGARE